MDETDNRIMAETLRKIQALEDLCSILSDLNLKLLKAQVGQLMTLDPANRPLLVRIFCNEEQLRNGPMVWRAMFPGYVTEGENG